MGISSGRGVYGAGRFEQADLAALGHALGTAGRRDPDGKPLTESTVFGLCGGIGFLYAVFEYRGYPPILTITTRAHSMPGPFLARGLELSGVPHEIHESSSAKAARSKLDAALDQGAPVLVHVDRAGLPHHGVPAVQEGAGPHVVGVTRRDGDTYWLDDGAKRPIPIDADSLDRARAGHRASKRRLLQLVPGADRELSERDLRRALQEQVDAFDRSPAKSFASNIGRAGLAKWARLTTDARDKKAWPRLFTDGALAYVGLRRAYDCVRHDYTGSAASRPLAAAFFSDCARWLDIDLSEPITALQRSVKHWRRIADTIRRAPEKALQRGCDLSDRRAALLAEADRGPIEDEMRSLHEERQGLAQECRLSPAQSLELFAALRSEIDAIVREETGAMDGLQAVLSGRQAADRL